MKLDGGYLLAIDPGSTPGFAIVREDASRVQSGWWRLGPYAHQGTHGRFTNLLDNLDSLFRTYPSITSVAFEMPGLLKHPRRGTGGRVVLGPGGKPIMDDASPETYHSLYGCVTHVGSWAERNELHYQYFTPQQAKKAATGSGNAHKERDVVPAIAQRFAIDPMTLNPNEADALAIALAGLVELGCIPPLMLTPDVAPKKRARKTTDEQLVDDFYEEAE
jgi:Holliday junction resolvasome RuvABC endonuclease subunit